MTGELVPMTEAAKRAGVSQVTFRDRVRRGEIVTFTNPRDRRSRLVSVGDLDRMMTPRPINSASGGPERAA